MLLKVHFKVFQWCVHLLHIIPANSTHSTHICLSHFNTMLDWKHAGRSLHASTHRHSQMLLTHGSITRNKQQNRNECFKIKRVHEFHVWICVEGKNKTSCTFYELFRSHRVPRPSLSCWCTHHATRYALASRDWTHPTENENPKLQNFHFFYCHQWMRNVKVNVFEASEDEHTTSRANEREREKEIASELLRGNI